MGSQRSVRACKKLHHAVAKRVDLSTGELLRWLPIWLNQATKLSEGPGPRPSGIRTLGPYS